MISSSAETPPARRGYDKLVPESADAFLLASGLSILDCGTRKGSPPTMSSPNPEFSRFVDDYFDAFFASNRTQATREGLHQYDNRLENLSASAVDSRIQQLRGFRSRLQSLRAGALPPGDVLDAELLDSQIQAELLDLETLQSWKKNPMPYVSLPGAAIDNLMKRNFAVPAERLKALVARFEGRARSDAINARKRGRTPSLRVYRSCNPHGRRFCEILPSDRPRLVQAGCRKRSGTVAEILKPPTDRPWLRSSFPPTG